MIRRNYTSLEDIKKAILATVYRNISTMKPQHYSCPANGDIGRTEQISSQSITGTCSSESQSTSRFPRTICFASVSEEQTFEQNSNESLKTCIWKLVPEHLHCGIETIQIATYIAVSIFHEGCISVLKW